MISQTCSKCGKTFETLRVDGTPLCYDCELDSITGNRPPEEGDFNTARLVSGEMTPQEQEWLRQDLLAVEQGRSISEPYNEFEESSDNYYEWRYLHEDED